MDIKAKLEKQLADNGEITGASVQSAIQEPEPDAKALTRDSEVELSDSVKNDPLFSTLDAANVVDTLNKDAKMANRVLADQLKIIAAEEQDDKVIITAAEKAAFIAAIIGNTRYISSFTLFNGALRAELRSRTQEESYAIFQRLNAELAANKLESQLAYSIRLRNMFLASQVKRINDTEFSELKAPLLKTVAGNDVTEPGWLDQVDYWHRQSDGLVSALYRQLRMFELKYLLMVENADKQNFW